MASSPLSPDLRQGALEALPPDVVGALQVEGFARLPVEHQIVAAAVDLIGPAVSIRKTRKKKLHICIFYRLAG